MADPDLVDVLCRGTETWNRFRDEHPESQSPNLSRADRQGLNLTDAGLHGANLTGANRADATLSRPRPEPRGREPSGADARRRAAPHGEPAPSRSPPGRGGLRSSLEGGAL